jgi:hypothetical protein
MRGTRLTDGESLAASLKAAVDKGEPWFTIAALVIGGGLASELHERRRLALKVIELSNNLLGRYISVLRRLREIAELHDVPIERLLSPVFSATEIAVRIYDRTPNSGLDALYQLKERRTTLAKLRLKLEGIEATRSQAGLARAGQKIEEYETALQSFVAREFGASATLTRRPALRPFARVGWIVLGKDRQTRCGIDLFDQSSIKHLIESALPPAIVLSTFFQRFFMLFPDPRDEYTVKQAGQMLDFFRADSFGTLHLTSGGGVLNIRKSIGSPTPDRSSDYNSLESLFAYGGGPRLVDSQ